MRVKGQDGRNQDKEHYIALEKLHAWAAAATPATADMAVFLLKNITSRHI